MITKSTNLISEVYIEMRTLSKECANNFVTSTSDLNFSLEDIDNFMDMRWLNKYWRVKIGDLRTNTIEARECLMDYNDKNIWMNNFKKFVLPVIIKRHLPKT